MLIWVLTDEHYTFSPMDENLYSSTKMILHTVAGQEVEIVGTHGGSGSNVVPTPPQPNGVAVVKNTMAPLYGRK